jgi:LacI family transcriptional regulator
LLRKNSLSVEGNWSAVSGEHGLTQLLARHPEMDGVFISNDSMALGAAKAARERGLHIPGDVAIVGFDDLTDAAYFCPALSTMRQDMLQLGRRAVRELGKLIEADQNGGAFSPKTILLEPELIVRASSLRTGN